MSGFNASKDVSLYVMYNCKREKYFIKLVTAFAERNVFHKGLTDEIVEENKNNPEFFYQEFFKLSPETYEDMDWSTSADYIIDTLAFKGDLVFSGENKIVLMEREVDGLKHQIVTVEFSQEDIYEDKREELSGYNVYSIKDSNKYSQAKPDFTEIGDDLMHEFHYLSSQKTASNRLSDIFDDSTNSLIHDWQVVDTKTFSYSF